jgi:hypothetical protein
VNYRGLLLLLTTIVPGLGAIIISTFYLFPEWAALDRSYRNYEQLSRSGAGVRELSIAQSAEVRHRINCFAEGIGVLLGGVIVAIGVHGLCGIPDKKSN